MKFEPNALLLFHHKKELPGTEPRLQLAAKGVDKRSWEGISALKSTEDPTLAVK